MKNQWVARLTELVKSLNDNMGLGLDVIERENAIDISCRGNTVTYSHGGELLGASGKPTA